MIHKPIAVSRKRMFLLCLMLVVGGLAGSTSPCNAADAPPPEGAVFPNINLPVPEKPEELHYLGLRGDGPTFTVAKIQAKVVILEIFSMYCPFCQKEAPNVKALYGMIEQNEDLKKQIKMIAVGAGNSTFEVNTYKNAYGMVFPHFADADFSIHDALGKVRTPYFIVIKLGGEGPPKVIYSRVGGFGEPRSFLELITK
jgi:thiol-disulfide isomerase/thioredoxin